MKTNFSGNLAVENNKKKIHWNMRKSIKLKLRIDKKNRERNFSKSLLVVHLMGREEGKSISFLNEWYFRRSVLFFVTFLPVNVKYCIRFPSNIFNHLPRLINRYAQWIITLVWQTFLWLEYWTSYYKIVSSIVQT